MNPEASCIPAVNGDSAWDARRQNNLWAGFGEKGIPNQCKKAELATAQSSVVQGASTVTNEIRSETLRKDLMTAVAD
ncbi:hypothetical protein VM1G_11367 [Cytospora mali]|uniref:Uncharacterized protein n=1 Tax=Cytospora mali TaxID=578113 RepID=A0A194VQG6_CYTMA|nr:hypothetical protein VM1G_11367 [Valsa mali]